MGGSFQKQLEYWTLSSLYYWQFMLALVEAIVLVTESVNAKTSHKMKNSLSLKDQHSHNHDMLLHIQYSCSFCHSSCTTTCMTIYSTQLLLLYYYHSLLLCITVIIIVSCVVIIVITISIMIIKAPFY